MDAEVKRYPTDKWAGEFLSKTMPPVPKEVTAKPRGLDSLNQVWWCAHAVFVLQNMCVYMYVPWVL